MNKKNKPRRTRRIIRSYHAKAMSRRSFTEKTADNLTSFFGSMTFLMLNLIIFIVWITINSPRLFRSPFDPYPYLLLTTFVSLEAIMLTIVVLMSQNREGKIATLRDELQLQVELISEKEISKALLLLTKLLREKGMKISDKELKEMLDAVDTSYIERKLEEQIEGKSE